MRQLDLALWIGLSCSAAAQGPARKLAVPQLLTRVAAKAEQFRAIAPNLLSDEVLRQRVRRPGGAEFETHDVASVYGFGSLPEAPSVIHEIRKVVSIDGKQVSNRSKAREAMTLGIHSADDKLKKRLLEEFEKYGLHGAVTDFGQIILLFSARHQKEFEFEQAGDQDSGVDRALVLKYKQVNGAGGVMVFRGNGVDKQALKGELLVRQSDGMPLRVTMASTVASKTGEIRDTLEVNYADSGFGCVVPASVQHRESLKGETIAENLFQYTPFRRAEDVSR